MLELSVVAANRNARIAEEGRTYSCGAESRSPKRVKQRVELLAQLPQCFSRGVADFPRIFNMITPAFELSQDPDFLTIMIRVPYARVSEFDVYFEGTEFKFYAKPYFLRLVLPGRIIEDGREKATYDDSGIFTIRLPKETPGEKFDGLDMLTALLAPKKSSSTKPLIEEMGAENDEDVEEEEEFDWEIEQTLYEENKESSLCSPCTYGFGNQKSGVFKRLQDELSDVIDIKSPDSIPAVERREKRLAVEAAKFDPDHYLADLFEDEAVCHLLKYKPWWVEAYTAKMASQEGSSSNEINQPALVSFTEDEKEQLRKFSNRTFLLDKRACHQVYLSLVDILLAYCYEIYASEGEKNVESPWNIRKLSSTLCWLETFTGMSDVLISFGRRVLCYPLYRHFSLVTRAINDTIVILQLGKSAVLKCLLDIHKIFRENDPAYILNDLYITDYCIWIQKAKSKKLAALAECMQQTELTKAKLGLELNELEAAALLVEEEEKELKARGAGGYKQPLPPSEEEASDSEDSSSTSSCETGGSDSEEQESSASEDGEINPLQSTLQDERTAPLIDCNGLRRDTDALTLDVRNEKSKPPLQSTSVPGKLIEELGNQMQTAIRLTEEPEGCSLGSGDGSSTLQETGTSCTAPGPSLDPNGERHFLEVTPKHSSLLLLATANQDS
uniref:Protein SHQ1 homolog n=1 Tax=Anolis carolinensis TaxID=28377 RepID=G1KQC4_ANOCA|nr:PREDICTED: protein SHQ1 homolog [Anolis carolinensis]|eukprot:XP_003217839.2 PREDICTED: protein SHQ1 homolog [Anolis carolinensis]